MKRDMDLVREILLKVEEEAGYQASMDVQIEGYPPEEVTYHIMLMSQAGLLDTQHYSFLGEDAEWRVTGLTWAGHEFLDSCRDEGIWKEAKRLVTEKAGGLVFAVLSAVLVDWAKRKVAGI